MDQDKVLTILSDFRAALAHVGVPGARLILYGSQAAGNSRPDSDIDVAVISETFEGKSFWDRIELLAAAVREIWGAPIEAVAFTPAEWESGKSAVAEYARNGIQVP